MKRLPKHERDKRRLKIWLTVFFLALTIPAGILIHRAYSQLKWEAFHRYRVMAEEFAARVDARLSASISSEETRAFGDYVFLVVSGDPAAGFLQRSALSAYPVESEVPGLIGYFQIDASGVFSTPLLPRQGKPPPSAYGISGTALAKRQALERRILSILSENSLVRTEQTEYERSTPAAPRRSRAGEEAARVSVQSMVEESLDQPAPAERAAYAGQAAFDQLNAPSATPPSSKQKAVTLGRVKDLKLEQRYQADAAVSGVSKTASLQDKRGARKEQGIAYEKKTDIADGDAEDVPVPGDTDARISIFESQVDAFEFTLLNSGHFALFRKVWHEGQRYIQGAIIEPKPFFDEMIAAEFSRTALSRASNMAVAYRGDVFSAFSGQAARQYLSTTEELKGALLYRTHASAPLGDVELIFSITRLPAGPGGPVIAGVAVVLLLVLCGGLILMYRLGVSQIELTRQQQDFVSAVSHELKTPLTSIRMYGEMLRAGWADEDRKQTYYNYIFDESERLSRLISNVLQLARMTRNDLHLQPTPTKVSELMDAVESKVSSQIEAAGFSLNVSHAEDVRRAVIEVDADAFTQIMINLVDNAVKFSSNAQNKQIDIGCVMLRAGALRIGVRDYGPGIPRDQLKKIFKLFYRAENELTRDTVGTGIGLALVHQLTLAMHGRVDVVNREPGVEFTVEFDVCRHGDT